MGMYMLGLDSTSCELQTRAHPLHLPSLVHWKACWQCPTAHSPVVEHLLAVGLRLGDVEAGAQQRHDQAPQQPGHPGGQPGLRRGVRAGRCTPSCDMQPKLCRRWYSLHSKHTSTQWPPQPTMPIPHNNPWLALFR